MDCFNVEYADLSSTPAVVLKKINQIVVIINKNLPIAVQHVLLDELMDRLQKYH